MVFAPLDDHRIASLLALGLLLGPVGGCGSDDEGPSLVGEPEVVTYDAQPMVVDVKIELSAEGSVELFDPEDDGVRVQVVEGGDGTQQTFRVWGLAPGSAHELELRAGGETTTVSFETPAALPGFRASFPIEGGESAEANVYRVFDFGQPFDGGPVGVFAVDAEGTTRWHWGLAPDAEQALRVATGVQMTGDQHVTFLLDGHAWKLGALSDAVVDVDGTAIDPSHFHHDLIELPNGNFVALGHSFQDVDYGAEGVLNVAGDQLFEFTPAGQLVWSWDTFDHMDPQRRRGGFEPVQLPIIDPDTMMPADFDWTHGNGVVYDASDDSLLLSLRHQDWLVKIDHASGDIVWRFGPEGDFELTEGDWFSHQHSPQWQADGSLLFYDNANDNPDAPPEDWNSRPVRYSLDYTNMTARQEWSHEAEQFVSEVAGDADIMPGGHVLTLDSTYGDAETIFERTCRIREIDPATDEVVWSFTGEVADYCYRAVPSAVLPGMTLQQ